MFEYISKKSLQAFTARDGYTVVVVGENGCWGRAPTGKEALINACNPSRWTAWEAAQGAGVDDWGFLCVPLNVQREYALAGKPVFYRLGMNVRVHPKNVENQEFPIRPLP